MRAIILFLLVCFWSHWLAAQRDTTFWFVAPDVSVSHEDRPVRFVFSTENSPANITISQPANSRFTPVNLSLGANSTVSHQFDNAMLSSIENAPPDQILNKGFLIESSNLVTAYYEVGVELNIDIFTLKGRNALGQEFIIPGQNLWDNDFFSDSYSAIEIVATADNTIIEFIPSINIAGHNAGDRVRINLSKGQTYTARALSNRSSNTLAGTIVNANKPIAITINDDSIRALDGGCIDLTGDQIVPIGILGQEYIVQQGSLFQDEMIFITTTKDNTTFEINGEPFGATLSALQLLPLEVQGSLFVKASEPVYVMQYTGIGCEIGAALIPSVNCKGSNQIAFSRSGDEQFTMNIIVRNGGQNQFLLNGASGVITTSDFQNVPGTQGEWKAASIDFNNNEIAPGSSTIVRNSEFSFQLGFMDGGEFSGARFGYFSNFSSLFIGDDITLCEGESRVIIPKGDPDATYEWSDGSNGASLTVDEAGLYWVSMINNAGCLLTDTLEVFVQASDFLTLPDNLIGCLGDTVVVDAGDHFEYQWSDGSNDRFLRATQPGEYTVNVVNVKGCTDEECIFIEFEEPPILDLGPDISTCPGDTLNIKGSVDQVEEFLWNTGSIDSVLRTDIEGIYWLEITKGTCIVRDTIIVENFPEPEPDSISGSFSVCPGVQGVEYFANHFEGMNYSWTVEGGLIVSGNGSDKILVDWGETNATARVNLTEINEYGCKSDEYTFDVRINRFLKTEKPNGTTTVCFNLADNVNYNIANTNGSIYTWNVSGGEIISGQGTNEIHVAWELPGTHTVQVDESSTTQLDVCFGSSEELEVLVFNDTTSVEITTATVNEINDDFITVAWQLSDMGMNVTELHLFRKRTSGEWSLLSVLQPDVNFYTDLDVDTKEYEYQYRIEIVNGCDQLITTPTHNTIVLEATGDEDLNTVTLNWNHYQGWESGVSHYEILRNLDDQDEFQLIAQVESEANDLQMSNASNGFIHELRIRAVSHSNETFSLSNKVVVEFEHKIVIPNVFTPNGDAFNETFEIPKIELYANNELSIFNRDGKRVYYATRYDSSWNGDGLPSGTYYYVLNITDLNLTFNGSVVILR